MDPVTHTLTGVALADAGLRRHSALVTATCLIGANLPDVDVATYAWGTVLPLAARRGWTHGVLALVVLPLVLTGGVLVWDRFVRRRRRPGAAPAVPRVILLAAVLSVLTHPLLDLLNVYGIRLLMPLAGTWFYGDVLFILDPWLWAILAVGVWVARRTRVGARGARRALIAAAAYIALMTASSVAARWVVWRSLPFARAGVERLMVAPEAVTPFRKWVVLDEGDVYRVGTFDWLASPRIRYSDLAVVPRGGAEPAVAAARASPPAGWFLTWARFPFTRTDPAGAGTRVHFIDARYALDAAAAFGAITVEVTE